MFEKTIAESVGNYQSYVIIPMDHERLDEVLSVVPSDKLYFLDIKPESSGNKYSGVFQNFEEDVYLKIGQELGILSYNETPLKKIAANGISVMSTNFAEMGNQIAGMVINKQKAFKYNTFRFINRGFF